MVQLIDMVVQFELENRYEQWVLRTTKCVTAIRDRKEVQDAATYSIWRVL